MWYSLPNLLSIARIVAAPLLVWLAYQGMNTSFLWLYGFALITDIVDGKLARYLNQASELGGKLDSWGDFALYMTLPLDTWLLRPDFVRQELLTFSAIVAAYSLPVAWGFVKYRRLTSYHTRGAVLSAYAVGAASFAVLAGAPAWPLRLAAILLCAAELEEIAITCVLAEWTPNVPTLRAALSRRAARSPAA